MCPRTLEGLPLVERSDNSIAADIPEDDQINPLISPVAAAAAAAAVAAARMKPAEPKKKDLITLQFGVGSAVGDMDFMIDQPYVHACAFNAVNAHAVSLINN
jgi:hypothetical protein